MGYQNPTEALSDTIKIWDAIAHFSDDMFKRLLSDFQFNHIFLEMLKREAVRELNLDEGIINYCPLCDYYKFSQCCLLSESGLYESCNFGCIKRWSCMDFQENIQEKDWEKARESARKFASELQRIKSNRYSPSA